MSAILPWWKERLKARAALSQPFMIEGYNYKAREGRTQDPWPARVARTALYLDYQSWYEKNIKPTFDTEFYRDHPEQTPQYANELVFFTTMGPLLYVYSKESQVRNYHVYESVLSEDRWVRTKVRRYFVKLAPYEEHVAAFRRETGLEL